MVLDVNGSYFYYDYHVVILGLFNFTSALVKGLKYYVNFRVSSLFVDYIVN